MGCREMAAEQERSALMSIPYVIRDELVCYLVNVVFWGQWCDKGTGPCPEELVAECLEGPDVCGGRGRDIAKVERGLREAGSACPPCGHELEPWGQAAAGVLRGRGHAAVMCTKRKQTAWRSVRGGHMTSEDRTSPRSEVNFQLQADRR